MRDYIVSILFIALGILISFFCYPLQNGIAICVHEICFIILGLVFTIIAAKHSARRKMIFVCFLLAIKPFIVLADELYDPFSLLGISFDIIFTGFALLIGYLIAKLVMFLYGRSRNKTDE